MQLLIFLSFFFFLKERRMSYFCLLYNGRGRGQVSLYLRSSMLKHSVLEENNL